MLGTLINSSLSWSKDSKGNRSSSRRARKSFELGFGTSRKFVNKDSKKVDMPVSESEKLGVTVLGCRFSQKVEHVPIKKRRFVFMNQSSPPDNPSPQAEETETIAKRHHPSGQGFSQTLEAECQRATSNRDSSADMGQIVDNEDNNNHGMKLVEVNEQRDENEDFSGISILAAAACRSSLGYADEGSGVEESFGRGGSPQELMNIESKDDLVNSADISTEGTGSCISPSPGEQCPTIFNTNHSSVKEFALEYTKDGIFLESAAAGSLKNADDAKIKRQESSARDDRLRWDLNIVMDDWEQPSDCQPVEAPANRADSLTECNDAVGHNNEKNLEGSGFQSAPECAEYDTGKALSSGQLRRLAIETQELNLEVDKLDACIDSHRNICFQGKVLSYGIDNAGDVVVDPDKETKSSHSQDKIAPNVASCGSVPDEQASGPPVTDIADENVCTTWVKSVPESGQLTNALVLEENYNAASTQVEKQSVTFPDVVLPDKAFCVVRNALNNDVVEVQRTSELLGDGNDFTIMALAETVEGPIDDVRECAACESDENGCPSSYRANSVAPPSGASVGGHPVAAEDPMLQRGVDVVVQDYAETDLKDHTDAEPTTMFSGKSKPMLRQHCGLDACKSYHDDVVHSYGEFAPEDPFGDGYDTDVSQAGSGILVGREKSPDLQVDYDSQYEDGELRESSLHAWEEYGNDDEETERVDYGSDNRGTNNLGSENTSESNFPSPIGSSFRVRATDREFNRERDAGTSSPCLGMQSSGKVVSHHKGSGSGPDRATRDDNTNNRPENVKETKQSTDLPKISGWDRLPENQRGTSDMGRVRNGIIRKNFTGDQKDGSKYEDSKMVFRSRVKPMEFSSRIDRSVSNGMFLRRDRLGIRGSSSNEDDSNPRLRRVFDSVKSLGRGRYTMYRGRGGGRWVDSSGSERGQRRHRSPSYHNMASFHHSRPEDVASDYNIIKEGGSASSNQVSRHDTNAYSRGLHRSFRRSGSPSDRRETFNMRRGIRTPGDMSPDRFMTVGRDRSAQYGPRVNRGGPRERYNGPMREDYIESSMNYSHTFTRRRRSFSPDEKGGNRAANRPSSKSRSRSRTRSPNAWLSRRGRSGARVAGNFVFRHRSRSPNFRPGAGMQRMRSPHSRPGFLPNHETGFMSAPRTYDSPPPNSRWIGYKRRSPFLDRRSPGRTSTRGERFDTLDSQRKPKPNEYSRPAHPGRSYESNGVGRGPRYEGTDDDRRKHGYRQRLVHHSDLEGEVKRFRHAVEDGFVGGHESRDEEATTFPGRPKAYTNSKSFDDVPRRSREDNTNSKSFGTQEGDKDASPRKRP